MPENAHSNSSAKEIGVLTALGLLTIEQNRVAEPERLYTASLTDYHYICPETATVGVLKAKGSTAKEAIAKLYKLATEATYVYRLNTNMHLQWDSTVDKWTITANF